jgi:predicted acyltransferase
MLMGVFYLVIEVWGWRGWCRPFIWIGANAITIYLASAIVNFQKLAGRLVGGDVAGWLGGYAGVVNSVVALGMVFWLAWFLYRRGIFLKV